MKSLFILVFVLSCGPLFANDLGSVEVEVTTKNNFEKGCYINLIDHELVVEQKPLFDKEHGELIVVFTLYTGGESSTRLSPELEYFVSRASQKSLTVTRSNKPTVSLETVIASKDLELILTDLLQDTAYNYGGTFAGLKIIPKVAEALREKCK